MKWAMVGAGAPALAVVPRPTAAPCATGNCGVSRLAAWEPAQAPRPTAQAYNFAKVTGLAAPCNASETAAQCEARLRTLNPQRSGETAAAYAARIHGMVPAASAPAAHEDNTAAIAGAVGGAIAAAGGTILELVRGANQAAADERRQAAQDAADRIAHQATSEQQLVQATTEAGQAQADAETALRQFNAGNSAAAIASLSSAQGHLAAAVGASAVPAIGTSPALTAAIRGAQGAVSAARAAIDAATPPAIPRTDPVLSLPPVTDAGLLSTTGGKVAAGVGIFAVLAAGVAAMAQRRS